MDTFKMPIKKFLQRLIGPADFGGKQAVENQAATNPHINLEHRFAQQIWDEAGNSRIFDQFNTESDWLNVRSKLAFSVPVSYHRITWQGYFLRIAAMIVLAVGLAAGLYKIFWSSNQVESRFIVLSADNQMKEILLPDGSSVSLNTGSKLTYRDDFGRQTRDVILEGEGLFNVMPDAMHPFKVYIDESVVKVTGTKFSVREENGAIKVSVISGSVLLSSKDEKTRKINITANQSGYLLSDMNEFGVEEGIPVNNLSWKTGHLVFEETPIDSALIDIARHFRKELSIETSINEEITAEFQNQPLHEILEELEIVAGLQFDTTRTMLIVRK